MAPIRLLDVGVGVSTDIGERIDGRPVDVVAVSTLAAAADRVDAEIDGVVTAYHLPDGDGIALLRAVRDRFPDLPVVVVAEGGNERIASDAIEAGVTDYVSRSADVDLGARIADAIADAPSATDPVRTAFPDLGFVVDTEGTLVEVLAGPTAETYLSDDPTALSGRNLAEALSDPAGVVLAETTRRALETDTERTVEFELSTPSGTEWFEARVAVADGVRAVVVARRITDRKRERRDIERQQAHLSQAQEVARIGSWHRHFPSSELWWSEMVYDIFGRSPEAGSPTHEAFLSAVHPDDRDDVTDQWEAALDGEPYDVEHRILVDGETRWVRERADFSFDDEGNPVEAVGIVHDITDRKEHERRLETTNERLDVLHRIARHDIRNRMNVVLGCATELRRALAPGSASVRMVDRIETAAEDLLDIGQQLRDADRVVTTDPDRQPVDVAALVSDLVDEFAADAPDVTWYTAVPDSLGARATPSLVVALANVVENAVEHNEGDRQRVAVAVTERDDDRIEIRVVDDGPGIPPVERELLVGDRKRTQVAHSSGLGLWLTRWIVANAGGTLDIHAGRRGGTVVTVDLPRADADALQGDR
jgi:PAS domain S-box-containing protein